MVIEHNLDVIRLADHVVEIGPEGGDMGGKVVFQGSPALLSKQETNTGIFLSRLEAQLAGSKS